MDKSKSDDSAKLLTSSITISCPNSGATVGPTLTVCGTYNPSFFCPYRIRLRVSYLDQTNTPHVFTDYNPPGDEAHNRFSRQFTLNPPPAPGEDVLISARLFSDGNVPLSATVTSSAVFDQATADICTGPCA